jgi:hypothetical protein
MAPPSRLTGEAEDATITYVPRCQCDWKGKSQLPTIDMPSFPMHATRDGGQGWQVGETLMDPTDRSLHRHISPSPQNRRAECRIADSARIWHATGQVAAYERSKYRRAGARKPVPQEVVFASARIVCRLLDASGPPLLPTRMLSDMGCWPVFCFLPLCQHAGAGATGSRSVGTL